AELGLERGSRLWIAGDLQRLGIGGDPDVGYLFRGQTVAAAELTSRIDRGKRVAAGRVVLECHVPDVERIGVVERPREIGAIAHRRTEASRAFENVAGAGDTTLGGQRRKQPGLGRVAGMKGLAHAVGSEGLL